jgi:hemerythrin-like domain-containing protein
MTQAYRIIRSEHFELGLVLTCLQHLVDALEEDDWKPDFDLLFLILDYIESFPETFHHPKEETYLFTAIRRRRPEAGRTLDQLCDEHATGVALMTDLRTALTAFMTDPTAREHFRATATSYVAAERRHIEREEQMILPIALEVLSEDDWREIDAAFAQNEHPLLNPARRAQFDRLFGLILKLVPGDIAFEAEDPVRG